MAFYKLCDLSTDARTDSYRFSVESKADKTLLALKEDISRRNKGIRQSAREMPLDMANRFLKRTKLERVKLMARGPRAYWAQRNGFHNRYYDTSLPHDYAVYFDVYVLTDWTAQRVLETEVQDGLSPSQQAAIARAGYEAALFKSQQARLLREKYGIVSIYTPTGVKYEKR